MDLKKSLRMALAKRDLKKIDLARKVGTSGQQVSNWLRTGKMKQSNLVEVSAAFDMSVSEFISLGEEE